MLPIITLLLISLQSSSLVASFGIILSVMLLGGTTGICAAPAMVSPEMPTLISRDDDTVGQAAQGMILGVLILNLIFSFAVLMVFLIPIVRQHCPLNQERHRAQEVANGNPDPDVDIELGNLQAPAAPAAPAAPVAPPGPPPNNGTAENQANVPQVVHLYAGMNGQVDVNHNNPRPATPQVQEPGDIHVPVQASSSTMCDDGSIHEEVFPPPDNNVIPFLTVPSFAMPEVTVIPPTNPSPSPFARPTTTATVAPVVNTEKAAITSRSDEDLLIFPTKTFKRKSAPPPLKPKPKKNDKVSDSEAPANPAPNAGGPKDGIQVRDFAYRKPA